MAWLSLVSWLRRPRGVGGRDHSPGTGLAVGVRAGRSQESGPCLPHTGRGGGDSFLTNQVSVYAFIHTSMSFFCFCISLFTRFCLTSSNSNKYR